VYYLKSREKATIERGYEIPRGFTPRVPRRLREQLLAEKALVAECEDGRSLADVRKAETQSG